ncbi:MAG: dihydroorotate dehydrogenase electron transfer subunit [Methanomassiliicoccaceae archaeon]|nr:dihydroorotate dehydrogenase electron transfer subunit [Methanomassiliicoccaceae archaeon]
MNNVVKITSVKRESHDTRTFRFTFDKDAKAGQFVMVWVPGIDEIPMSLSSVRGKKSITVKAIGDATNAINKLEKGNYIGIRGPYGNGFSVEKSKNILIVGGGVGVAALMPLVRMTGSDTIIGARNKAEIIMKSDIERYSENVWVSTDDGSYGFKGNAVDLMKKKMKEKEYDLIVACGPEIMLYYVHKACTDASVDCQLSLERFMKCGAGLCGSCVMDGMRICEDGPVFNSEEITELKELGRFKRSPSGKKVKL